MVPLRVSCILPVYNGGRFLGEALDSAFAQSYAPFQVIVVDDGSIDDTAAIALSYGDRVTYVRQENAGPAAARNRGILAARGDLVALLDADDLWLPEKLARQVAQFTQRPDLDVSTTLMQNVWVADLLQERERLRDHPLTRAMPGATSSLVARHSLFDRLGLFDAGTLHKDVVGWLVRASQHGAVIELLPEVLVHRRIHESNLSRHRDAKDVAELLALAKLLIDQRRQSRSDSA